MKQLAMTLLVLFAATTSIALPTAWGQNSSLLHAPPPEMIPAPTPVNPNAAGAAANNAGTANERSVVPPEYAGRPTQSPMRNVSPVGLPNHNPAVGLRGVSWTYQQAPPLRQFHIQDIVTIRVDEITRMQAEGESEKRRTSVFSAVLSDWVKLTMRGFIPDPQDDGDPTVAANSKSNFTAEASVESRESLTFNVAARIVDIRPNGNLVLEARKKFRHNDNLWETSLSGICRAQDIGPDNVILSKDLIDLEIHKEDRGQLRDDYSRGWFQKAIDRIKPF
ncbi:flagellar basal body L-ring protein FlgH [Aporhodopirellula aestuarii]|uniref:Flagellar basal body L-ring protein FlgH n=1 Tax=Aporhodopirellula aestuarii TaxID=2950107 RepID=A0ABT0U0P3_9BACT|nr:flagellar basal body L-ring protein FlgH [Aporhodopirellula aestuarii]MCM2370453.1 flagellar basal body L-ring protein FlgH [Aporhodopirellula aestuarii]